MSTPAGPPNSSAELPWVANLTIGEVLRQTAAKYPDQDACVFCQSGDRWTWKELDQDVDRVARALLSLGLNPGDHFGIWATNVPQWVLLQLGSARAGIVLVNINPSYRTSELKYALQQSEVKGLALIDRFKTSDYFASLNECCPELAHCQPGEFRSDAFPNLRWVISLQGGPQCGMLSWAQFLDRSADIPDQRLSEIEQQIKCTDPVNIQYTSGTTGNPKGAMLSHRNLLLNAFYGGENQQFTSQDRISIPVPLYHCFGCVLGSLCAVVHGAAMIFPSETFQPDRTLQALESERCTAVYGVPTMFIAQFEHRDYPNRDLSTLRTGIMAGAPCPIELMKRVTREMGAREITIGYGQTEASPLITQTRTDDPLELRVGTIGRPLPNVEVRIVDPATGGVLPDGEQGELCCRGHVVMLGYFNMPDKTAAAIDSDGWLHTGDLAVREPNGYFRITGRIKDLIIRGGENIYPREVEERLFEHSAVEDVQVVGVPDVKYGEEVLAWIKLRKDCTLTAEEVKEFCGKTLARFKIPRYVKFVDAFPTTVTGKIQKFKIREQAIHELGLEDAARVETA